jgi:hypothetical protein
MARAGLMEKIMNETSDTSKFDHAKLENRALADSELEAVSGGLTFAVDASTKVTATGATHKTDA